MESVVTNSCYLADVLEKANCTSKEKVERILGDEVKVANWEHDVEGFEKHMQEEEEVRLNWNSGAFEKSSLQRPTCGDKNAWDRTHACCQDECKKTLNALQTFPLAA